MGATATTSRHSRALRASSTVASSGTVKVSGFGSRGYTQAAAVRSELANFLPGSMTGAVFTLAPGVVGLVANVVTASGLSAYTLATVYGRNISVAMNTIPALSTAALLIPPSPPPLPPHPPPAPPAPPRYKLPVASSVKAIGAGMGMLIVPLFVLIFLIYKKVKNPAGNYSARLLFQLLVQASPFSHALFQLLHVVDNGYELYALTAAGAAEAHAHVCE